MTEDEMERAVSAYLDGELRLGSWFEAEDGSYQVRGIERGHKIVDHARIPEIKVLLVRDPVEADRVIIDVVVEVPSEQGKSDS